MENTRSNLSQENERLRHLMQAAGLGWWEADFKEQTYRCSATVVSLLCLQREVLSFAEFTAMIREDYRERITVAFTSIRLQDDYNHTFPVNTAEGEVWITSVLADKRFGADGRLIATGTLQRVPAPVQPQPLNLAHLTDMIARQNSIGTSLLAFLQLEESDEVIEKALLDTTHHFQGTRAFLCEYDYEKGTMSCTHEAVCQGVESLKGRFQQIPIRSLPWWNGRIGDKLPIMLNAPEELPESADNERRFLLENGIRSVIVTPLVSRDRVWGFVGMDNAEQGRTWTNEDYQWFSSFANIISISMLFHSSEWHIRHESESLQRLYRHMPTGYVRMKLIHEGDHATDFTVIDINEEALRICGEKLQRCINAPVSLFNDEYEWHLRDFEQVIATGKRVEHIFYLKTLDRHLHSVLYSPAPDQIIALFNDITDEVLAHQALEKSEALMRNIVTNLPVGIELYDSNGTLLDLNEKDLEIFGLSSKEEVLGINLFSNPNIPPHLKACLRRHEDVSFSLHYDFDRLSGYYRSANKGRIYLSTKITALYDSQGNFSNFLFINIDNTETTNAYSKIQEFEDLFSLVGQYAKVGYAHFNGITRDGYAQSSWYENLGEQNGTPLPEIIGINSTFHPDDRAVVLDFQQKARKGEANHLCLDARIRRADGNYTWTRINMIVKDFRPEQGVIEMVCVNYDITTLKRTEEKLRIARDRAEESDRLKSAFLANMSHEIRTPLNAIVGFSNLLSDTDSAEQRGEYFKIVQENNDLLLQLISDILDVSKIEAGTFEFSYDQVDVRNLCSEIVRTLRLREPEGVTLCFDESQPDCALWGDKSRIKQVLTNFITNAFKFTHSGSVTLGYERLSEQELRFWVRDTGIGIAPEQIDAVFQRFVKLNSFVQGTGLGLPICRSIVEQIGGRIGAESVVGEGSLFWFTHPIRPRPRAEHEAREGEIARTASGETKTRGASQQKVKPLLLVAEDIDSNYLLLEKLLCKQYTVTRASDGLQAVEMFRRQRPDLVLMDLKMPRMDGIEATRLIRSEDALVPIVAITAFAFDDDRKRALEAGCNDYIAKPLSASALYAVLKKWLG